MALTVLEELQILNGKVGPGSEENPIKLLDLIHQSAVGEGVDFHINYKVFDTVEIVDEIEVAINVEANNYLIKILSVIDRVYKIDNSTVNSLVKLEVSLIGNSAVTWQQVQDATNEQWETFIVSNMLRTFELLGRVLKSEKIAYNALP